MKIAELEQKLMASLDERDAQTKAQIDALAKNLSPASVEKDENETAQRLKDLEDDGVDLKNASARDLSPASVDRKKEDGTKKSYDELVAEFEAVKDALDKMEEHQARRSSAIFDGLPSNEVDAIKNFNLVRALAGHMNHWQGHWKKTPEYKVYHQSIEKATVQQADVDILGGFLVPPEFQADRIIPALEAQLVLARLGATFMNDLVGSPWESPKITGTPDATDGWVGEGQSIGFASMTMGQLKMTPHGLAKIVPVTRRLLRQTSQRASDIVVQHLSRATARSLDLAGLKGTGAAGKPVGVVNNPDIGSVDFSSAVFPTEIDGSAAEAFQDVTELLEQMIGQLEDNDVMVDDGNVGWAMHPQTKRKLKSAKDLTGKPILFDVMRPQETGGRPMPLLWSYPFATTTQLAGGSTADFVLGKWEHLLIGSWGPMLLETSTEAGNAFIQHLLLIKSYMEADTGIEHSEAFAIASGFDVSGA